MKLYGAIDLHSNNSYLSIMDEQDNRVYKKRLPNDLGTILHSLSPYRERLEGIEKSPGHCYLRCISTNKATPLR